MWQYHALLIVSIVIFLYGFLPSEVFQRPTEDIQHNHSSICTEFVQESVDKLVFVVIDAWRLDFLTKRTDMAWARSAASAGSAVIYEARARTPTVTLPRLKALTTGVIPSFASVLFNFGGSGAITADSWPAVAKRNGKRLHFFGDDSWIALHNDSFDKSEGVVSFFVKDYTEVDTNVTRNIQYTFEHSDEWDVLVLHYLGLDHIGHSLGGTAPEIGLKLIEMDNVLHNISILLSNVSSKFALIAVGDHGMTSAGGHGGASPLETSVPLFIHTNVHTWPNAFSFDHALLVEQIDVPQLVLSLLGLEPLSAALGVPVLPFFNRSSTIALPYFAEYAIIADNLARKITEDKLLDYDDVLVCADRYQQIVDACKANHLVRSAEVEFCDRRLRDLQLHLIQSSSKSELKYECLAVVMLVLTCVFLARGTVRELGRLDPIVCGCFVLSSILTIATAFASSLVEEEHDVVFFLFASVLAVEVLRVARRSRKATLITLLLFVLHRVCSSFNAASRRRYAMQQDLLPPVFTGEREYRPVWSNASRDLFFLWAFRCILVTGLVRGKSNVTRVSILSRLLQPFSEWTALRVLWLAGTVGASYSREFIPCVVLLSALSGPQHAVLLSLIYVIGALCRRRPHLLVYAIPAAFFYTGNSNSIATINVIAGYAGLTEYSVVVALQILLNMYSGPITLLLGSGLLPRVFDRVLVLQRAIALCAALSAHLLFSSHLFVWSVFAPKALYETSHCLIYSVLYFLTQLAASRAARDA